MSNNNSKNLVRSLLTCLSLLSFGALTLSACGEDSSLVGNWSLTSVDGQPVDAVDTAIMQIEAAALTADALGCNGNILALPSGDKLTLGGYNAAPGCRIEFLRPVQENRSIVHDVLALNPVAARDPGNSNVLIVTDTVNSRVLTFVPSH